MDRNEFLALILLALISASSVSDASLVTKLRRLVGEVPKPNSTKEISPVPGPGSGGKNSDSNLAGVGKPVNNKSSDSPVSNSSSKGEPTRSSSPGAAGKPTSNGKDKGYRKVDSQMGTGESCDRSSYRCIDQNKMIACTEGLKSGSRELVLLVQNEGERTLKVNLTVPAPAENGFRTIEIPADQTKRIKVPMTAVGSSRIVLNAGHGDCIILVTPPALDIFLRLPPELVTPINGAYLMLFTVLMFGGAWAFCKFRRRRRHGGVYQELEMGLPESASTVNVETSEGWDQGWGDDWDEDTGVTTPTGPAVGNVSANGLTSRSSNKDGWENDWDG